MQIDGVLRVVGNLTIRADVITFGPSAQVRWCALPGAGADDGCTRGRNVSLIGRERVTVATSIDLRGGQGASRPGGSLTVSARSVLLTNDVRTDGSEAPSGRVVLTASGGHLVTQGIFAPGAPIALTGRDGVSVFGSLRTSPGGERSPSSDPSRPDIPAGPVSVRSGGGDVVVMDGISAGGLDGRGQGRRGGSGAAVTVVGGDVRIGGVDTTGGRGFTGPGGTSAGISLAARQNLQVTGALTASGATSDDSAGSSAGRIALSAGGHLTASTLAADGGTGDGAGGDGGAITVRAASATLGNVDASGGGKRSNPPAGRPGHAARVTIAIGAGDLAILGSVDATGGSADLDGIGAGNGAPIDIRAGGAITVANVFAFGGTGRRRGGAGARVAIRGRSLAASAISSEGGEKRGDEVGFSGNGAGIAVTTTGELSVIGAIDSSGGFAGAAGGRAGNAGGIELRGGTVHAGGIFASGGAAGGVGGRGARILVRGKTLKVPFVAVDGGDKREAPGGYAGSAGSIDIDLTGGGQVSRIEAGGGSANADGREGGAAGTIRVHARRLGIGQAFATPGQNGQGARPKKGGSIRLDADDVLEVGFVTSAGGDGGFQALASPLNGADAGPIVLRGARRLVLGGVVLAQGGRGGQREGTGPGGRGGRGGNIDLVGASVEGGFGVVADGGSSGNGTVQGEGGAAGRIRGFTGPELFDGTRRLSTTGGDGDPRGLDGERNEEQKPSDLKVDRSRRLSFTSNSPDAEGYRILRTVKGVPPKVVATRRGTAPRKLPRRTKCGIARFTVVAFHAGLGWQSAPSNTVRFDPCASSRRER